MTKTRKASIVAMIVAVVAVAATPASQAFHGGWWRGHDEPTTHAMFPNPGSRAISATGQVFDLDFQWGGGGGVAGTATIEMYDPLTGALVHSSSVFAAEDISSVVWVACPFPNTFGTDMEDVPLYSLIAPGVLSLGPGAPGGSGAMHNSFCNDQSVPDNGNPFANDPTYYKAFSDYSGTYIASDVTLSASTPIGVGIKPIPVPAVFHLEVHVRGLDHA